MKQRRQAVILELIEQNDIDTQEALLELLLKHGYKVTQATISRDIKELQLVKGTGKDGRVRYQLTVKKETVTPKFNSALTTSIVKIDFAGNLVVIATYPGMANAVATCIDTFDTGEIVGCVAGDDTIMVVVRTEEGAAALCHRMKKMLRTI